MSNPGVSQIVALLNALKDAVRDFAAREEKINGDFRAQSAAAARLADDAAAKRAAKLADAVDAENAALEERKIRRQADYENRKARIAAAHAAVRKRVMDEIGEQHGHLKHKIQASSLEAERNRDDALAATVVTLENFRHAVAESAGALEELTKAVRRAFGGGKFRRLLSLRRRWPEPDLAPDENNLFAQHQKLREKIRGDLKQFKKFPLPKLFRFLPPWLLALVVLAGGAVMAMAHWQVKMIVPAPGAGGAAAVALALLAIYFLGTGGAVAPAKTIAGDLAKARRLLDTAAEKAEQRYQLDQDRIRNEFESTVRSLNEEWRHAVRGAVEMRGARPVSLDEKAGRAARKNDELHRARLEQLDKDHAANLARLRGDSEAEAAKFSASFAAKKAALEADFQSGWQELENQWKAAVHPLYEKIRAANAAAERDFPDWNSGIWKKWTPPQEFNNAAKFGRLEVAMDKFAEVLPKDKRLALPELNFPPRCRWAFRSKARFFLKPAKGGEAEAVAAINNVIFRLLSTTPPGQGQLHHLGPGRPGPEFRRAHAPGRLRGSLHQQPHLDADDAVRGKARRAERAHGKGHPDVSAQRIRHHRRIQRAGRQHRREISFPRHRVISGQLQRHRRAPAAQHRRQRRPLRRLYAHPLGPAERAAQ